MEPEELAPGVVEAPVSLLLEEEPVEPVLSLLGAVEEPLSLLLDEEPLEPVEPELPVPGVVEEPRSLLLDEDPLEPLEPELPVLGVVEAPVLPSPLPLLHPVINPNTNIAPKTQVSAFFIFLVSFHHSFVVVLDKLALQTHKLIYNKKMIIL